MQKFYQEGIVPPDVHTYEYAEEVKLFMENRSTVYDGNTSYGVTFNDQPNPTLPGRQC